jgi:hypothetical protein
MNKTDLLQELFFLLRTLKTKKLNEEQYEILYNHYIKLKHEFNI